MCGTLDIDTIVMAGEPAHAIWLAVGYGVTQVVEIDADYQNRHALYHQFRFRVYGKNHVAACGSQR